MSNWETAAAAGNRALLGTFGESVAYRQPGAKEDVTVTVIWGSGRDQQLGVIFTCWALVSSLPLGFGKGDTVERGGKLYEVRGFVDAGGNVVEMPAADESGAVTLALRLARKG